MNQTSRSKRVLPGSNCACTTKCKNVVDPYNSYKCKECSR